jgi:hypothetical protein
LLQFVAALLGLLMGATRLQPRWSGCLPTLVLPRLMPGPGFARVTSPDLGRSLTATTTAHAELSTA